MSDRSNDARRGRKRRAPKRATVDRSPGASVPLGRAWEPPGGPALPAVRDYYQDLKQKAGRKPGLLKLELELQVSQGGKTAVILTSEIEAGKETVKARLSAQGIDPAGKVDLRVSTYKLDARGGTNRTTVAPAPAPPKPRKRRSKAETSSRQGRLF